MQKRTEQILRTGIDTSRHIALKHNGAVCLFYSVQSPSLRSVLSSWFLVFTAKPLGGGLSFFPPSHRQAVRSERLHGQSDIVCKGRG